MQLSICAERNIIDAKHHIIYGASRNIICDLSQPRSFVSEQMINDVFATLKMMLTFGQMMLCPADTNEKSSFRRTGIFGAGGGTWLRAASQSRRPMRLCSALRSGAALTPHRGVIHSRAHSSPHNIPTQKKEKDSIAALFLFLVPVVGLEPTRCCQQRILSPSRLPVPTHRHVTNAL